MNEIFSRLKFRNESLDSAVFEPIDQDDETLTKNLNLLAKQGNLCFTIEATDPFGENFELPIDSSRHIQTLERVKFSKEKNKEVAFFFTREGFLKNSCIREITEYREVYIIDDFADFRSSSCKFKKWKFPENIITTSESSEATERNDPRKIIRDATGEIISPHHGFWISPEKPESTSEIYEKWLALSTFRASALLASEIWATDRKITLTVKGNKTLEIEYAEGTEKISSEDLIKIQNAIDWIFDQTRDIEVRHTLLCQRLASEQPKQHDSWIKFLSKSIYSSHQTAKEDYRNHIHIKTGELLKAVTDIRKTVSEEINKITEKTQSLTSGLLRDLSISFTIIALRQVLVAKNIIPSGDASILLIANIFWLIINIFLTAHQNKLYFRAQIKFRYNWSKRLSNLISKKEFNELSRKPFKDAINSYKEIKTIVNSIYTLIIISITCVLVFVQ